MPPAVRVSFAIQTHPSRLDLAEQLAADCEGADIVIDPDTSPGVPRNPWRTYRECLARTPDDCTHRVILQDDARPATPEFRRVVTAALEASPHRVVALYVGGNSFDHVHRVWAASSEGKQWTELQIGRWLPVVAAAYPAGVARDIATWCDMMFHHVWPASFMADDEIIGRYLEHHRIHAVATVPCLVDHPDVVPSLLGKVAFAGEEPGRISCCPPPDGCDLTQVDWKIDAL